MSTPMSLPKFIDRISVFGPPVRLMDVAKNLAEYRNPPPLLIVATHTLQREMESPWLFGHIGFLGLRGDLLKMVWLLGKEFRG